MPITVTNLTCVYGAGTPFETTALRDVSVTVENGSFVGILGRTGCGKSTLIQIMAGLLIGPSGLGLVELSEFLAGMAEVGVVLLMFSAGLETDLKELMKTGPVAFLIACSGVFVPLVGGTLLYMGFYGVAPWGSEQFYTAVFIGVIMTATSVSITVQALKEMGRLKGKVGTTILSAAIIDDVIGIIVLTFVIGFKNPDNNPGKVVISTVLFFVFAIIVGYILYRIFKNFDERYPHTRRIPIISLAICFAFAYVAEKYFGIADITGAYVAGIVLCSMRDSSYIDEKMEVSSYMIFGPVFFASIGLKTSIDSVDGTILLFSLSFVLVALITKIIGCGIMAKLCKFNIKDSFKIGVGMMTRGEVALIVSQKGLSVGMISPIYFTAVIFLIIVSSISTPIILKFLYKGEAIN